MATNTFGTVASTSLTALQIPWGGSGGLSAADLATVGAFKDQPQLQANSSPLSQASYAGENRAYMGWARQGNKIFLPNNRTPDGILLLPGDWVAVDANGWPIVVSGFAAAASPWAHS